MNCLNCGCSFDRRPVQQYFCSSMCWEDATKNTPWRILSGGLDPVTVKLTTSKRYPSPHWPNRNSDARDARYSWRSQKRWAALRGEIA